MKVEILMAEITKLASRTRVEGEEGLVTTVQFRTKIPAASIARIINLQRQGAPLYATIGSTQATMDIDSQERRVEQMHAALMTGGPGDG